MNCQILSNLEFRPLLKILFHCSHIELKDANGEKLCSVSAGITRLVLMFRMASNIVFSPKRRYKMIASLRVEILFYKGVRQKSGR